MVVLEGMLVLFFVFGLGTYAGTESKRLEREAPQVTLPEKRDTMDRMLQCRAFCGNKRTRSYDSLTGFCECTSERHR